MIESPEVTYFLGGGRSPQKLSHFWAIRVQSCHHRPTTLYRHMYVVSTFPILSFPCDNGEIRCKYRVTGTYHTIQNSSLDFWIFLFNFWAASTDTYMYVHYLFWLRNCKTIISLTQPSFMWLQAKNTFSIGTPFPTGFRQPVRYPRIPGLERRDQCTLWSDVFL